VGSQRIEYKPLSYHKETVLFIPKWLTLCFTWLFHAGRFAFNLIHPNGTGFHNVLNSSPGWINHPCFSPDSKNLLFTSDYARLTVNWSQCHISSSHMVSRLMALDWLDSVSSNKNGTAGWGSIPVAAFVLSKEGTKSFLWFQWHGLSAENWSCSPNAWFSLTWLCTSSGFWGSLGRCSYA